MKSRNAISSTEDKGSVAPNTCNPFGSSPRLDCAALVLMAADAVSREYLDRAAGASNSPQIVLHVRRLGLYLPVERRARRDHDGRRRWPGFNVPTDADWTTLAMWIAVHGERA